VSKPRGRAYTLAEAAVLLGADDAYTEDDARFDAYDAGGSLPAPWPGIVARIRADAEIARAAFAEVDAGAPLIPAEQVRAELGIDLRP
jgi:hypothetical protein